MIVEFLRKFKFWYQRNAATNPGKGKLSRTPILNPKSEPFERTPVPFEMLETEPVQIEFTEPTERTFVFFTPLSKYLVTEVET